MQRSRGRGRARGSSNSSQVDRLVSRRLSEMTKGSVFRPTLVPPLFSSQPWNNVIVRILDNVPEKTLEIKLSTIFEFLSNQLGLFTESGSHIPIDMELRIQSISVWLLSEASVLKLMPIDFLRTGNRSCELANVDSMSQKNMYATAGYIFPTAHSSHVFLNSDPNQIICAIDGTRGPCEIHVKAVWRGARTADIKSVFKPIPKIKYKENRDSLGMLDIEHLSLEDVSPTTDSDVTG